MTIAYIFPGQGSQYAGMGRELAERYPAARDAFAEADNALGFSLARLCFDGPAEELQLTENTQPAILTTSVAALRAMQAEGFPAPSCVAGHSLGEYTALVAASALSLHDAVQTVRARGRYMQEAVPVGIGAMAAILGVDIKVVEEVCREVAEGEVCVPANINSPDQIVIAGDAAAIERALPLLKDRGAKRAIRLKVSAPFHCSLMQPAQARLAADLAEITFNGLSVPLVTNADASVIESGAAARDALVRQVSSPVRWRESVDVLAEQCGAKMFIEVGPGKVLSKLVRQTRAEARCVNVEDAASLAMALAELKTPGATGGN